MMVSVEGPRDAVLDGNQGTRKSASPGSEKELWRVMKKRVAITFINHCLSTMS